MPDTIIQAVFFDFDGVLVDTMPAHFRTWKKLAHFLGFKLHPGIQASFKGASRSKSLDMLLREGNISASNAQKEFYAHMKNTWYDHEITMMDRSILMPGVLPLLEELKSHGIITAIASSSANAVRIARQLNIDGYFDLMLDANDIQATKPDPAVFTACIKQFNLEPRRCIVLEDSIMGIEAAHAASCKAIGIGKPEILDRADLVLGSLEDINLEILEKTIHQ